MRSSNASRRNRGRNTNGRRNGVGINQIFESNGSNSKVKGNAQQVNEKYQLLARDAKSSGDSIKAENYFQHADHFMRILKEQDKNRPIKVIDDLEKNQSNSVEKEDSKKTLNEDKKVDEKNFARS